MNNNKHLTESEILEFLSRKQTKSDKIWQNRHVLECVSCQNELSSYHKTVDALKTIKLSREERLRLLTNGVTTELEQTNNNYKRWIGIPAVAAVVTLMAFGIYFYASYFGLLSITTPETYNIPSMISFSQTEQQHQVHVTAHTISFLGKHSNRKATSQSIGLSVLLEGEEFDNGQSQNDSLSVTANYIATSYSTSF